MNHNSILRPILRTAAAAGLLCLTVAAGAAHAEEGPWLVRVRALNLDPANKDSTPLNLSINSKVMPEFDVSYFFTPHWSAELVLTVPQAQSIRSNGTDIGSLRHLPPTLMGQYNFLPTGTWRPYVGLGLNETLFSKVQFNPAVQNALHPSVGSSSFGFAYGGGLDVQVAPNVFLNFDVKKVIIHADIKAGGTPAGTLKVDPVLAGVGIGYRF